MNANIPQFLSRPFIFSSDRERASQILHKDLKTVLQSSIVKINDQGNFVKIGLISWVWEQFKEILGLDNCTNKDIIRFRFIQFIAQAAKEGLITEKDCVGPNNLITQVARKVGLNLSHGTRSHSPQDLDGIFRAIIQSIAKPDQPKPNLTNLIGKYQHLHRRELEPHSLFWKAAHLWQKEKEHNEGFTQSDFGEAEEHTPKYDQPSEFPVEKPTTQTITEKLFSVLPLAHGNNPSAFELLQKLKETQSLADELKKETTSQKVNYKDLYIRSMMIIPALLDENAKLVLGWVSEMLSFSTNEIQKFQRLDTALKLLDFKNAFSLLVAGYRLPLFLKNQGERLLDTSASLNEQCQRTSDAMGERLTQLIQEHPEEYNALDLSDLSPNKLRFNADTLPYQFRYLLLKQHQMQLSRERTEKWLKLVGLSLFGGALLGGASYAYNKLTEVKPLPEPTLYDYVTGNIWRIGLALGSALGLGAYIIKSRIKLRAEEAERKENEAKSKREEAKHKEEDRLRREEAKRKEEDRLRREEAKRKEEDRLRREEDKLSDKEKRIQQRRENCKSEIESIESKLKEKKTAIVKSKVGNVYREVTELNEEASQQINKMYHELANAIFEGITGAKLLFKNSLNSVPDPVTILFKRDDTIKILDSSPSNNICRITPDSLGLKTIPDNSKILVYLANSEQKKLIVIFTIPGKKNNYVLEVNLDFISENQFFNLENALRLIELNGDSITIPLVESEVEITKRITQEFRDTLSSNRQCELHKFIEEGVKFKTKIADNEFELLKVVNNNTEIKVSAEDLGLENIPENLSFVIVSFLENQEGTLDGLNNKEKKLYLIMIANGKNYLAKIELNHLKTQEIEALKDRIARGIYYTDDNNTFILPLIEQEESKMESRAMLL